MHKTKYVYLKTESDYPPDETKAELLVTIEITFLIISIVSDNSPFLSFIKGL